MRTFWQWLSQNPKTFTIANSATQGRLVLQVSAHGQIEGELDNLTAADLQVLLQTLNQYLGQQPAAP